MRRPPLPPLRRLLYGMAAALLAAGCYDGPYDEPAAADGVPVPNCSVSELQRLFTGDPVTVTADLIVAGRITSSDRSGNFYRTLLFESGGGALELLAGLDALHNDYPPGTQVTLRLEGLCLGRSYGVLQAGRPPAAGSSQPGYIGSQAALDRCLYRSPEVPEAPVPTRLRIDELQPALCGLLVRIEGLHYAPKGLEERRWAGFHRFADEAGRALFTSVSDFADFADEAVPYGSCSLTGILQYGGHAGGSYQLKLRDATDHQP